MSTDLETIVGIFEATEEYPKEYDLYTEIKAKNQSISLCKKESEKEVKKVKRKRFFRLLKSKTPYDLKIEKLKNEEKKLIEEIKKDFLDTQEKKLNVWKQAFRNRCLQEIGEVPITFREILKEYLDLKSIDILLLIYTQLIPQIKLTAAHATEYIKMRTNFMINPFKYTCMHPEYIKMDIEKEFKERVSPAEKLVYKEMSADLKTVADKYNRLQKESRFFGEKIAQTIQNIEKTLTKLEAV